MSAAVKSARVRRIRRNLLIARALCVIGIAVGGVLLGSWAFGFLAGVLAAECSRDIFNALEEGE